MSQTNPADTATLFFTKYSEPHIYPEERKRFRSTFQASKIGDQKRMDEIENMYNNYNLFKYGQVASSTGRKRNSTVSLPQQESSSKHKNMKERSKDNEQMKLRLLGMRAERQVLFEKLTEITSKNVRKN